MKRKGKKLKGAPWGPLVFRGGFLGVGGRSDGRSENALKILGQGLDNERRLEHVVRKTDGSFWRTSITA
jgi:hypothetical protein